MTSPAALLVFLKSRFACRFVRQAGYHAVVAEFVPGETGMAITVEAVYENGVFKPKEPLPLKEHQRIKVTIHEVALPGKQGYGLIRWTGSTEDLDYFIEDAANDPLERP
jgi:predicted DNA-binding antitoxin AbrB/MazE fold protein